MSFIEGAPWSPQKFVIRWLLSLGSMFSYRPPYIAIKEQLRPVLCPLVSEGHSTGGVHVAPALWQGTARLPPSSSLLTRAFPAASVQAAAPSICWRSTSGPLAPHSIPHPLCFPTYKPLLKPASWLLLFLPRAPPSPITVPWNWPHQPPAPQASFLFPFLCPPPMSGFSHLITDGWQKGLLTEAETTAPLCPLRTAYRNNPNLPTVPMQSHCIIKKYTLCGKAHKSLDLVFKSLLLEPTSPWSPFTYFPKCTCLLGLNLSCPI